VRSFDGRFCGERMLDPGRGASQLGTGAQANGRSAADFGKRPDRER